MNKTKSIKFQLGYCEQGKPVCKADEISFKCKALRPKTINACGDLVHYCGIGEQGQMPLRETSPKRGIVRPNKACPLHNEVEEVNEVKPLSRNLHYLGRLGATILCANNLEFNQIGLDRMTSDIEFLSTSSSETLDKQDLVWIMANLSTLPNANFDRWESMFFQKVLIPPDTGDNPVIAIRISETSHSNYANTEIAVDAPISYRSPFKVVSENSRSRSHFFELTRRLGDSEFVAHMPSNAEIAMHNEVNQKFIDDHLPTAKPKQKRPYRKAKS